ncbi:phosphate ABC transporter substrate-binding protein [Halobacteriales archaeon SW_5_70_135]|nr:MAG: phosphate ABC transporter substrate-binding protein [Halobacteriales archaeon SW_5_70_135]
MSDDISSRVSRRKFIAAAGAGGVLALAGCTDGGDGGDGGGNLSGEIFVTGSSTVFPLAVEVADRFERMHEDVSTSVERTGSGGGFENFFCPGDSDINNASRPIKDSELENCRSSGVEPVELKVATDALTVIVNNENDFATELTFDQLAQIWGPDAGADQTWADIDPDWPDEEVNRFGAATTSGTFDFFTETVNGEEGVHTQDYSPTEQDRNIVQGVQGDPYGIGYFGFSYYFNNQDAATAVAVSETGDEFFLPSLENAASDDYPLARPLFTYPDRNRLTEDRIAEFCRFFVEKSTSKEIVADTVGYVPNTDSKASEVMETLESAVDEANSG